MTLQVVQEDDVLMQGQLHSGTVLVDLTIKLTNWLGRAPAALLARSRDQRDRHRQAQHDATPAHNRLS